MSLRIVLSGNERGFFHPGDCVKGVVRLNVPREGRAESISLSFFGRSLVIIPQGGGDNSRSCGYLFRQQIILQQGLQFHANQTFYWPFAFQLPRHASFLYPDEINAANIDGVFCNNPPWRGSSEAETIALPSSNLYEGKFNCQVEYVLQARLSRPPSSYLFSNTDCSTYTHIIVFSHAPTMAHFADSPARQLQSFHQSFFISPSHKARRICSLPREILRRAHHRDQVPSVPFRSIHLSIHIFLPKLINLQARSPIQIGIRGTHPCNEVPQFDVHIKRLKLDLISHTKVRASSASTAECRRFRLVEATCEIPVRERDPLEDQYYAGLNTELDHEDEYLQFVTERGLEVTYLEKHATVSTPSGSHLVPEFVTYNIFRAYSLVVVCEMDYGDERFTFTKKGIPVQLFNCEPHEHAIELDRGVNVRQSRVGSVEAAHELDVLHTTPDVVGLSEITAMEPPPSYTASIS